jgi:hypothetical protein
MASQITKDFQMKSKLRKMADGGSMRPSPSLLGNGAAEGAARLLGGRGRQIDAAVDAAVNGGSGSGVGSTPPSPISTARQEKSGLRSLFGMADGGQKDQYLGAEYTANKYQQAQLKHGGRVKGPGDGTDDKVGPVMLSNKEYVLPEDTADAVGRDKLDALRLATHDFKDQRKESALRGEHKLGPGLADGGNPWIVDPDGNVNPTGKTLSESRAVGPARTPRPPIDITPEGPRPAPTVPAAEVTDVAPKVRKPMLNRAAGYALRAGAPTAGIAGAAQSLEDLNTGYRDHFQNSMGVETPLGSFAADTARVLGNVGDAATFGLAGRLGRGLAGIGNDGFVNGFLSPSDRDQYLQRRAQQPSADAAAMPTAASPLRAPAQLSDQPATLPVAPGSYQSRRLSEMGVPLGVQNSAPFADPRKAMDVGGTGQYQNLGTYGGNGNIYGKADDPRNPGRMNNFVGVGEGASPANAVSGSGSRFNTAGSVDQRYVPPAPEYVPPGAGGYVIPDDRQNANFEREIKQLYGKNQGNLAKQLIAMKRLDQDNASAAQTDATDRYKSQLRGYTDMRNEDVRARATLADVSDRQRRDALTAASSAQAAQQKAMENAAKQAKEDEEKGYDRFIESVGSSFVTTGPDGKQIVDKAKQERFRAFAEGDDVKLSGKKFMSLSPQDRAAVQQNLMVRFDMNEARNQVAQDGSIMSNGGATNHWDAPTDVRKMNIDDWWNGNLPLKSLLWGRLNPLADPYGVPTESGQVVPFADYTSTGGEPDLDKEKIVRDSVAAYQQRSKLRGN